MDKIGFHKVVPHVFKDIAGLESEVWNRNVSFERGGVYLVKAASGKGKSTFCSYVIGYRHDYDGIIAFDDDNISKYEKEDWISVRQRHVSYLFQELRMFPELTALENVEIKNRLTGFKTSGQINRWFDMLGIADKRDEKIRLMSYGQQQRVAFIRALVQPFDFILLDEPISHLDDVNAARMGEIVEEEAKIQGAGIIMTSIGKHVEMDNVKIFRL